MGYILVLAFETGGDFQVHLLQLCHVDGSVDGVGRLAEKDGPLPSVEKRADEKAAAKSQVFFLLQLQGSIERTPTPIEQSSAQRFHPMEKNVLPGGESDWVTTCGVAVRYQICMIQFNPNQSLFFSTFTNRA